jgi:predicted PurR-regulated permease PerM
MNSVEAASSRKVRRILVNVGTAVLIIGALYGVLQGMRPLILPLILGTFLAYLCKPLVNYRGTATKKFLRTSFIFLIIGSSLYWGFRVVKESLPNDKEKLELKVRLKYRLNDRYNSWMGLADNGKGNLFFKAFGNELIPLHAKTMEMLTLSDDEKKMFEACHEGCNGEEPIQEKYYQYYLTITKQAKEAKAELEKSRHVASLTSAATTDEAKPAEGSQLSNLIHLATTWLIFPLSFIFILLDKGQIIHFFMRTVPNPYFELAYTVVENVDEALGKYIRGTILECILVGVTLIVGFFLSGMELKVALVIGLIGGITNAIPFVGTFIACIVGAAYSLIAEDIHPLLPFINHDSLLLAVLCVVMITHLLDNAIYQPLVVGSAVDIHPLAVIIGVFGGSMMFGFAGLIFAIPTIVIVKVVTETLFTGLKDYRII